MTASVVRPFGGRGVALRGRCDALAVSGLRVRVGDAADPAVKQGASMTPWTAAEVARLRRAYGTTPSALAIWRSGAFPGRTLGAISSALRAHRIYRGRPDAPPGLRRSSTMLTVEQIPMAGTALRAGAPLRGATGHHRRGDGGRD